MPLFDINGLNINVRQWGQGEPLFLIHGVGTRSGLWTNQVPVFAAHYHVIAIDVRGFGRSDKPSGRQHYSIERMAGDVIGVCDALGLSDINLLGASMGGFIAQQVVLSRPGLCKRLVLAHTSSEFAIPADVMATRLKALDETSMDDYAKLVAAQALAQPPDPMVEEWLCEMIADNAREPYKHALAGALAEFDLSARISAIDIPTLVIAGSDDRVLPPAGGRSIAERIPGAKFHLVDAVGHIGYAEKPETFNRLVMDFLKA